MDVDVNKKLYVSKKAHLILPTHRLLDAASEAEKGKAKIGSTLKGIGPTYMDKTGRNGLRVGDIFEPGFEAKYRALVEKHERILGFYNYSYNLTELEPNWFEGIEQIKQMTVIDSEQFVNEQMKTGKAVLAEGAQGSLLDIDFGSYPFVTSSNTVTAGACTGLGVAPNRIGDVIGIFKAYCTRVGSGPFPTELFDADGDLMRKEGHEFGATTGRPRRCGWIDLPALRYAIMINGVTQLCMTKADVLSVFEEIKICTHYMYKGERIDYMPYSIEENAVQPVYDTLPGWKEDLTQMNNEEQLPDALQAYILYLEKALDTPITIVSVGPNRSQTMTRSSVLA